MCPAPTRRMPPVRARSTPSAASCCALPLVLLLAGAPPAAAQPAVTEPPGAQAAPVASPDAVPLFWPDSGPPPGGEAPRAPAKPNPLAGLPLIGKYFRKDEDGVVAPDGTRVAPRYALEVEAPEPVARQIREFTLLGRWRHRPDYEPSQFPLFVRRAPEEVRELLAAEGWFAPEVSVVPIAGGARIVVVAGPRTTVNRVELSLDGPVTAPEHRALRDRVGRLWELPEGTFFRSADWERAKRDLLGTLRDGGFLRARIDDSEAIVDLELTAVSLRVGVASGPRLAYGDLEIAGLQRYPDTVVRGLSPFSPGDPYDAVDIAEFQTRLNGGGWFTAVNVRPDVQALERDPALEQVPIRIDVVERQAKRWSLGGGYDTDRGFNVLAGWENRNVFGTGIQNFNGIELDLERQLAYSTWDAPQGLDGWRWQFGARIEHRDVQNDLTDSGSIFGSRSRRRDDIETATSLQYQTERQSIVFAPGDERKFDNRAVVLGYSWTQRKLDSPINPTRGYIATVQVSGASEPFGSERSFTRGYGFGYGIVPFPGPDGGEIGRLVVRGELGLVFAGGREGIPSTNLFRTGGTKSIRGYGSQSLGVKVGEATVGGRFLAVASVEYQHPIDRDISLAAFYDWGNAADTHDTFKGVAGMGVGVRYRSPVGPLNLDFAYGEETGEFRVHFSIGVVF